MFKLAFFENVHGFSPIYSLIQELEQKAMTDEAAHIELRQIFCGFQALAKMGTNQDQLTRHIQGGLWELKVEEHRVLFFKWGNKTFVLVHYFKTVKDKVPESEMETANRRMKDWENNHGRSEK